MEWETYDSALSSQHYAIAVPGGYGGRRSPGAGTGAGDSWFGELSCLVEPGRQALLSSQVPGVIETIQVEPGDRVAAGDTLFTLKRDVELASVALERARADYAERRVQRNQRMIERGMLSDSERDEIDTEMRLARMQVNLANARLEQMTHRAPFAGLITQRVAEEGNTSTPHRCSSWFSSIRCASRRSCH